MKFILNEKFTLNEKFILTEAGLEDDNTSHTDEITKIEARYTNYLSVVKTAVNELQKAKLDLNPIKNAEKNVDTLINSAGEGDKEKIKGAIDIYITELKKLIPDEELNKNTALKNAIETLTKESNGLEDNTVKKDYTKLKTGVDHFISGLETLNSLKEYEKPLTEFLNLLTTLNTEFVKIKEQIQNIVPENTTKLTEICNKFFKDVPEKFVFTNMELENSIKELVNLSSIFETFNAQLTQLLKASQAQPVTKATDWDAQFKNASSKEEVNSLFERYYKEEWGNKAEAVKALGDPFYFEVKQFGFTPARNPFIAFLKWAFKENYTISPSSYSALHNCVADNLIAENEIRHENKGVLQNNNLIYNRNLYTNSMSYTNFISYIKAQYNILAKRYQIGGSYAIAQTDAGALQKLVLNIIADDSNIITPDGSLEKFENLKDDIQINTCSLRQLTGPEGVEAIVEQIVGPADKIKQFSDKELNENYKAILKVVAKNKAFKIIYLAAYRENIGAINAVTKEKGIDVTNALNTNITAQEINDTLKAFKFNTATNKYSDQQIKTVLLALLNDKNELSEDGE